jgi:tRNA(Ile)-lysidine synthase
MSLSDRFIAFIKEKNLFSGNHRLLLAVSGGVDSVVLCELCKQAGFDFVIAHCNFQLRGEESEQDHAFVQQLAAQYGVPFLSTRFDTEAYASEHKLSVQEAARKLRYNWFEAMLQQHRLQYILTAHHLNDNIETMVMHFFRGTGIQGLRGMLPKQGPIMRPLLFATKESIRAFAVERQLQWREDSSNVLDKYTRNYFRNQLLPMIQQVYPEVEQNLAHNLQRFADVEMLYEQALEAHRKKLLQVKGEEVHIPVLKLKKSEPLQTIVYEIIKVYGFSAQQVAEVIALFDSETGKYMQSASHRIIKNRNWLIIAPLQATQPQMILIEAGEDKVSFEGGKLLLKEIPVSACNLPAPSHTALVDASAIKYPLILRKWKRGDYFYPLGMRKKKKLARFFIDQKLSMTEKEKVWVIEMNKKIVWVVGMRIDDRFKITDRTQHVLRIDLKV